MKKIFKFAATHAGIVRKVGNGIASLGDGVKLFGQGIQKVSTFLESLDSLG